MKNAKMYGQLLMQWSAYLCQGLEYPKLGGSGKSLSPLCSSLRAVRTGEGENLRWSLWRRVSLEGLGNGFLRCGDLESPGFDNMGDADFSFDVVKGPLAITDELVVLVTIVQLVVVVVEAVGLVSVAVVYALTADVVATVAVVIPLSVCEHAVDVIGVEQGLLQEVVEGAGHSPVNHKNVNSIK